MKNNITKIIGLACLALYGVSAQAQILMSSGFTYAQNFDSLASTGTANAWVNNTTLPGWYGSIFTGSATNDLAAYRADGGAANSGAVYSYGTNGVGVLADRAIGALGSGSVKIATYGVRFTNDTGSAISNIAISYTGEEWRAPNGTSAVTNTLSFSYLVGSSPITNADATSVQTWIAFNALDFKSPFILPLVSGAFQLDGNSSTNTQVFTNIVLTGVTLLPGQEIFLRWKKIDETGSDGGLAVDNLTVTYTNVIAVATAPVITTNPASLALREGDTASGSVATTGTAPIGYFWFTIEAGVTNFIGTQNPQTIYTYVTTNLTGNQYFVVASNSVGSVTSSVANITVTSSVPISATIAYLRTLHNASYALTDTTNLYTIEGVVITPNLLSAPLQSYFVWDGTGGIDVFNRDGNFQFPAVGDRVKITGPLFNFSGLLELNITNANPSHHFELVSSGNPLPTPAAFDFATAGNPAVMESGVEGSLVYVTNVFLGYTNTYFVASTSILMTNMNGKTFNLGIPGDTIGDMINKSLQAPPFASSVVGVVSQNTGSAVPTNGYSVVCFYYANINWTNNISVATPISFTPAGTNGIITWPLNLLSLQTSTNVEGPYVTIPGATSPYTNNMTTNATGFFRLVY